MVSIAEWLNPTRITGLIAYLLSFMSCAMGWLSGGEAPSRQRLAAVLTAMEAAFFLDIVFSGRLLLHDLLQSQAIEARTYELRSIPQLAALGVMGGAAAVGIGLVLRRFRDRAGASLALVGVILSWSCWCAEVISLHQVDAALYYNIHGIMIVGVVWAACSLMTSVGILWDLLAVRAGPSSA